VNELNPTDISYVHSVYAPLSVRLVQVRLERFFRVEENVFVFITL
jgi:hypothetical protein